MVIWVCERAAGTTADVGGFGEGGHGSGTET
jgi:hypothetical protein